MSVKDKEIIENRFGPLWSGPESVAIGDRIFTLLEIKRAFGFGEGDIIGIDLQALPDGRYAYRYYDGDDRRIVVFVFDGTLDILEEHRAHIAEWLGDEYHKTGIVAFIPDDLLGLLRKKMFGNGSGPAL
ncbi:MAG: hypothetical protein FIA93_12735 [Deltaproteobacteria bacterium]|nr:hypothetical protein [Deltaproteobacteria bacterium]PWB67564.1 MAG: hypothetical protein C3F14_01795 [Deltaproteobacteria bacterium]